MTNVHDRRRAKRRREDDNEGEVHAEDLFEDTAAVEPNMEAAETNEVAPHRASAPALEAHAPRSRAANGYVSKLMYQICPRIHCACGVRKLCDV